jgi:hypothetical protein
MLSACPFRKNEMRPVGPEVKHDLVIFFKVGVSNQQVEEFFDEILARRNPTGTGFRLRAGIREYSREHPVDGHEAVSISFFPSATVEERETVMRDVKSSPIVYRVLENVAPADVKKLEDMKEPETSPPVVKPK